MITITYNYKYIYVLPRKVLRRAHSRITDKIARTLNSKRNGEAVAALYKEDSLQHKLQAPTPK